MKKNILHLICAVCFFASCVEEQRFEHITPTPGVEVAFSANTAVDPETRTLYGPDADDLESLMVKWVNGDKIKVYGNTCAVKEAEYSVKATTALSNTPNADDGQIYADDLIKTGAAGVQWGSSGVSDFYAIYPSEGASFTEHSDGAVTIKTKINASQNYLFNNEPTNIGGLRVWQGTHFGADATEPSMLNAIMYAYTKDAPATDESGGPKKVDLHFKPFSTVFKFRFMGYTSELSNVTDPTVLIQSITITAPDQKDYYISGDFSLDIAGNGGQDVSATAQAIGNNSKSITLNTMLANGSFLPLKQGQAVDFNVFAIPLDGLKLGGDITRHRVLDANGTVVKDENGNDKTALTCEYPWTVTITTQGYGSFTYTVIPNATGVTELPVGNTIDAKEYSINAGQIHKIKVPQLRLKTQVQWNPNNWITQIPKPVYISELSVPGAWYCFDSGYQYTTDLAKLYKAGIRAFNIDCRITKRASSNDGIYGDADAAWSDSNYPNKAYLACAGTETNRGVTLPSWFPVFGGLSYEELTDGTYVIDAMKNLVSLAQSNKEEYIVVVFTFAEKPKTISEIPFGSVNPIWIMTELNTILNTSGIKEYLYTNITPDTTIDDITAVQSDGKVKNIIVKINHCIDDFYTNPNYSNILPDGIMGSFGSMSSDDTYNLNGDLITDIAGLNGDKTYNKYFTTMQSDDIYNGSTYANMTYCYHQAQNTSSDTTQGGEPGEGIPSLGMRMDAVENIITQSQYVYDNALHNHWFQLGIGGSLNGDNPSGVSSVLNPFLNELIQNKMKTTPSPVGIVLMNHCTNNDTNFTPIDLVLSIIEMNGKFYLNREGNDIITGEGNTQDDGRNVAYAFVGENAF